jgi:hypothetical protein
VTTKRLENPFEKGFQETLLYKERTGNPNAPTRYKTAENYRLGSWQRDQRNRKGKLSPDRIKRLEDIGFTWKEHEEHFEKGFQETLLIKNRTGNPNVLWSYKTDKGFKLGIWQKALRVRYKMGKVSPDRIKRLADIGFTWEIFEELFEKGFQETFLYKERTGISNVPHSYKTAEGYRLGIWQANLRVRYKMGKLSPDQIKRLEDIGFKWRIRGQNILNKYKST